MIKTLIVGRTASGKSTLGHKLEIAGFNLVKSYTTRERRNEKDTDHIFITRKKAKTFKNKVATTDINGNHYFATAEQIEENDYYIVDPRGIYELLENMPDTMFRIYYIKADEEDRKNKFISRGGTEEEFYKRNEAENESFTEFENKLKEPSKISDNLYALDVLENDYTEETLLRIVAREVAIKTFITANFAILIHMKHMGAIDPDTDIMTMASALPINYDEEIRFLTDFGFNKTLEELIDDVEKDSVSNGKLLN